VDEPQQDVTRILGQMPRRPEAAEELLALVYEQLRAIARARMRGERADHTLDATALVHEVYMKLLGGEEIAWEDRGHFFRAAAEAMRRILIDHARKRDSKKRGGGKRMLPLSVVDLAEHHEPEDILAFDEAIQTLEKEDPRAAEVVRLRFLAGLSVEETAAVLDVSERTVMREWAFAKARLYELLESD
jgi:RNA polymerase sigma factor (TIGR02999 family)